MTAKGPAAVQCSECGEVQISVGNFCTLCGADLRPGHGIRRRGGATLEEIPEGTPEWFAECIDRMAVEVAAKVNMTPVGVRRIIVEQLEHTMAEAFEDEIAAAATQIALSREGVIRALYLRLEPEERWYPCPSGPS